ncbi:MAG: alpha/beta hydrolase [Chloroflexota bacterium]
MAVNTSGLKVQASAVTQEQFLLGSVISKDGTTIGYRQFGHGPGIVIVHGSMSSGYNHLQLAQALSDTFTVYLVDRRGRGLSGPYRQDHSVQTDVEDVDAVLTKTGAHNIFAVSVGATICLEAALTLPAIHKLAIYEPLLFPDSARPTAMIARFDQEMAQGKVAAALTTATQGAQLASPLMNAMPHWLLTFMTNKMMGWEPSGEYVSFKDLAPTLHYEGQVIADMSGRQERFKDVQAEVLLLGGSQSSAFLKHSIDRVAKILPRAKRIEFPGLNHSSSWNTDVRGKPEPIAHALRRFFA